MVALRVDTPGDAVLEAWRTAVAGSPAAPRGEPTREVIPFRVSVSQPAQFLYELEGRALVPSLGMFEALQLVGQTSKPDMAELWPGLARYRDGGVFDGAYGLRIHGMLQRLVQLLADDPASRQAVLSVWDTREDMTKVTMDKPCTLSLQFLLRGDRLDLVSTMRSNDVWLGLPYDLGQFSALLVAVADALRVRVGTLHHAVGSLHLYERNAAVVEEILATPGRPLLGHMPIAWGTTDEDEGPADRIATISRRARMLLAGERPPSDTTWELFCHRQFKDRRFTR